MATNYKVLGQTSATAAANDEILNLVRDPSFEGLSLTSSLGAAMNSTNIFNLTSIGLPLWNIKSDNNAGSVYKVASSYTSTAATHGNKAFGLYFDQSAQYYSYWIIYGQSAAQAGTDNMSVIDATNPNALSVLPSTVYYFGASIYTHNTSIHIPSIQVSFFNSSGVEVGGQTNVTVNDVQNTWVRTTGSATSPANAAYAMIKLNWYPGSAANGTAVYWDAVHFSAVATTNTTFPDALSGSDLTLTAPFTARLSTAFTGTANASTTGSTFAGANVDLYTVPASTQTVASTVTISNLSTSATTYRIAVVPSGQTLAKKHWLVFDVPISANSVETYTIGITLATGDKIVVSSTSANVSFSAFGSEIV